MAKITYRLPAKEPYSYAEVELTLDDLVGPDMLSAEERINLLQSALADLDGIYPDAPDRPNFAATQDSPAPAFDPTDKATCVHGARKHSSGKSAKGPWQAYFCQHPDKPQQCPPNWLKNGEKGWVY